MNEWEREIRTQLRRLVSNPVQLWFFWRETQESICVFSGRQMGGSDPVRVSAKGNRSHPAAAHGTASFLRLFVVD
jgi:hypothetical protein